MHKIESTIESPAASLARFNKSLSDYEYRAFPKDVLTYARNNLNKSEKDCWEFLYEQATFNKSKMVKISRSEIGKGILRSERTVARILIKLESIGFIYKVRKNKFLEIHVRAPSKIIDRILIKSPRKKPCYNFDQEDIFGSQKLATQYYINNNTNNSKASQTVDTISPITEMPVVDNSSEIQKQESRLSELQKEIQNLNTSKKPAYEIWPKLDELYKNESILKLRIKRLRPHKTKNMKKFDYLNSPGERIICDFEKTRLSKAGVPEKIKQEIAFAVRKRGLVRAQAGGELSVPHGISIALKLYREKRWQTPAGMAQ